MQHLQTSLKILQLSSAKTSTAALPDKKENHLEFNRMLVPV